MKKMYTQKIIPVRIDVEMHRNLRNLAHLTEISMAEIIRQGIKIILEQQKKVLTNNDIAI